MARCGKNRRRVDHLDDFVPADHPSRPIRLLEHEVVEAFFSEVTSVADKRGLLLRDRFSVDGRPFRTWVSHMCFCGLINDWKLSLGSPRAHRSRAGDTRVRITPSGKYRRLRTRPTAGFNLLLELSVVPVVP